MSLDPEELRPCAGCGRPVDGSVCDAYCAERADQLKRERELREARAELERRRVARKAQFASWGPK